MMILCKFGLTSTIHNFSYNHKISNFLHLPHIRSISAEVRFNFNSNFIFILIFYFLCRYRAVGDSQGVIPGQNLASCLCSQIFSPLLVKQAGLAHAKTSGDNNYTGYERTPEPRNKSPNNY